MPTHKESARARARRMHARIHACMHARMHARTRAGKLTRTGATGSSTRRQGSVAAAQRGQSRQRIRSGLPVIACHCLVQGHFGHLCVCVCVCVCV